MPFDTTHNFDTRWGREDGNSSNLDFPALGSLQVMVVKFVSSHLVLASRGSSRATEPIYSNCRTVKLRVNLTLKVIGESDMILDDTLRKLYLLPKLG